MTDINFSKFSGTVDLEGEEYVKTLLAFPTYIAAALLYIEKFSNKCEVISVFKKSADSIRHME